jgi:predicted lactoylglutathione lyase
MNVPSGTELARPFVPAKDLEMAKRFYTMMGFEKVLDSKVEIFRVGSSGFILSDLEQAENFMMQLMVDDLDQWRTHIMSLDLESEFGVRTPVPPAVQPRGLRRRLPR